MTRYFLDSSALVKRYHQESGSLAVESLFNGADNRFFISRLALVEIHSAFARLVREGVLTEADFGKVILGLNADIVAGVLSVVALSSQRLEEASLLFVKQGLTRPIRTLDAIHLATAQALDGRSRIAAIVAADKKMLTVAVACGLPVLDVS